MDEKDNSIRRKRGRVLRATDVMPPFDKLPNGVRAEGTDRESSKQAARQADDSDPAAGATPDTEAPLAADAEIPKYDLAENILAEQRRVAAGRRRAPGQVQEEPVAVPKASEFNPPLADPTRSPDAQPGRAAALRPGAAPGAGLPPDDLPELQRIVAEIVARDIDRLCRRPTG